MDSSCLSMLFGIKVPIKLCAESGCLSQLFSEAAQKPRLVIPEA